MVFFSIQEVIDILIMTLAVGFIFKDVFGVAPRQQPYDPLSQYQQTNKKMKALPYADYLFAIAVTAPAIIFHEFGHKFVALGFGLEAVFHAAYMWLGIGVIMKLFAPGFIFFVPAYVSISGGSTPLAYALIAFAGPAINLAVYLGSLLLLKYKHIPKKYVFAAILTRRINGFLFIFNMLPIPGFDGFQVYAQLFSLL